MSEQPNEPGAAEPTQTPSPILEPEATPDVEAPGESPETITEEDEAHEPEEVEGQQGDQGEPEPPEAHALSQKDMEQRLKRLEKSSKVWRERVATILEGDAAMLVPCPLCETLIPGYVMPTPDTPQRFPAVREFMGDAAPASYEQDPNVRQCASCAGQGMVATGSKVQGQEQLVCTDCGGKGWQGQRAPIPATGPMAVQPLPDANGQSEVTPQGPEPPEAAKLRAMGYTLIQPVGA